MKLFQRHLLHVSTACIWVLHCGASQAQVAVRIGTSLGLTGVYAEFGLAPERGYKHCVNATNAKIGVLGLRLELTVVDDKSDTPAAVTIYKRLNMLLSPAEGYLEGLIDIAAERGLKTVAVIYEDTLFSEGIAQGAAEPAKRRGLQVVALEGYTRGTKEFKTILGKFKPANVDVIAAAGSRRRGRDHARRKGTRPQSEDAGSNR